MNCLKSSASSFISDIMTRTKALSCSIRAFWASEFCLALRNFSSFATCEGIVSVIISRTRSSSSHAMSPKCSLKMRMMFDSRSISGSGGPPPLAVGTGSISASSSGSRMRCAACFSTR